MGATNQVDSSSAQREILDLVESWLVDPRRDGRLGTTAGDRPRLEPDVAAFLSQHGLT